jgi:D-amino peptidase
MNIYLSSDMEGTAGVCSWAQCDPSNAHEYPIYRRYMTREVRAAVEGARLGGATEFTINDSHWDMRNLLWEELPEDVRVISGSRKPGSMTEGLSRDYAAAMFTGYHGKAGAANATLAHTYTSDSLYNVRINGTDCSEALLNAALAGYHGVPLVLITGDRTIVDDIRSVMPWVTGVVVKDAIGYYAANSMTPAAAQTAIAAGAREAMGRIGDAKPFRFEPPIAMELEMTRVECADFVELMPGFTRVDGRTIRYVADDYGEVFRAFVAAFRLAGAALTPA